MIARNAYNIVMRKIVRDNRRIAIFRLTGRCNQKCLFCCQKGRGLGEEPGIERVKKDLAGLRRESIGSVVFMHGESLLRKDLPEIVEYCREIGFGLIGIATNGTRLDDADFLEKLLLRGMNMIEISIHSHLEEPANLISGRSFTWEKQRIALENLARAQHRVNGRQRTVESDVHDAAAHRDHLAGVILHSHVVRVVYESFLIRDAAFR